MSAGTTPISSGWLPGGESAKASTLIYDPVGDTWRQVQGPPDRTGPVSSPMK